MATKIKSIVDGFELEVSTTTDEGKPIGRIAILINGNEQESILLDKEAFGKLIIALGQEGQELL